MQGPWGAKPECGQCGGVMMIDCEARWAMSSQPAVPGKWCLGQINLAAESQLSGGGRNQGSLTS